MSVLLLLDTSGSMYGEKITIMQQAVTDLLAGIKNKLPDLPVGIITFGDIPVLQPFATASEISLSEYEARGKSAFQETMALVESIKPDSMVLISDGIYDNNVPLIKESEPTARFAINIGYDADLDMLTQFAGSNLFSAFDAENMAGFLVHTLSDLPNLSNNSSNVSAPKLANKTDEADLSSNLLVERSE